MTRSLLLIALACASLPGVAAPEAFSFSLGAWEYGIEGDLTSDGNKVEVFEQDEPGLDVQLFAQLPFESFGSPAIRARYLDVSARSDSRVTTSQSLLGIPVVAGNSDVDLDIDVEFYDLYLIWDWGDRLFISGGVGLKAVDAQADATVVTTVNNPGPVPPPGTTRQTDQAEEDFGFTIPALYLGGGYQVNDWLTVQAEVDGLGDGDNRFLAGQALLRITPVKNFGIEAGWRVIDIQGKAGNNRLDVQADGPFLAAVVEFGGS